MRTGMRFWMLFLKLLNGVKATDSLDKSTVGYSTVVAAMPIYNFLSPHCLITRIWWMTDRIEMKLKLYLTTSPPDRRCPRNLYYIYVVYIPNIPCFWLFPLLIEANLK